MRERPVGWKTIDRDSLAKISILPRRGFAGHRQRDVSSDDVLKKIRGVAWWPTLEEVRLRRSGDCRKNCGAPSAAALLRQRLLNL
jgi:hypothetical protein